MTVLQAILLGLIQGLSEFIPISSTAHLTLAGHLFGVIEGTAPEAWTSFMATIQLGTLLAVFVYFARDVRDIPLAFIKENYISNYNKKIHELFKLAGFDEDIVYEWKVNGVLHKKTFKKYQLISSHTARRTMITNNVERGLNVEEIRRASGHKSESAFGKYVLWNND